MLKYDDKKELVISSFFNIMKGKKDKKGSSAGTLLPITYNVFRQIL